MDTSSRDGDSDPNFQAFREEVELNDGIKQKKAEKQSAVKKLQRFAKQNEWRHQIKRTQAYLGLLNMRNPISEPAAAVVSDIQNLSISGPVFEKDSVLPRTDGRESQRATSESWVLFVSVDVEAFEYDQSLITEIGISTLDTKDLVGIQPGVRGSTWVGRIRSHHFRVREHGHLVNRKHVAGCPGKFDFGESGWISIKDVSSILEYNCHPARPSHSGEMYRVVLVGHDVSGDVKYLSQIGVNIVEMFSDCIDTSDLYKASNRDNRQCSLSGLLLRYGIAARNLHNAGNDARFTLCVMIAMALDHFQNKRSSKDWEIEKLKRMEAAFEKVRVQVCAELEGWSTSEDEDAKNLPSLPPIVDQIQGKKANPVIRRSSKPNTESTPKQGPVRRQPRPRNTSHMDRGQSDLAVQDNPYFQDPLTRPYGPSQMTFAGKNCLTKTEVGTVPWPYSWPTPWH
ncbi:hypothetical protein MMC07_000892 [Pseudocyphellaria aurata]|nr:hypothetical protein [Pseudocyphellaria aurata]